MAAHSSTCLSKHVELRFSERDHFSLKLDLGSRFILQEEDHLHMETEHG